MIYAINVAQREEAKVISQAIAFAWDAELIRVARLGAMLLLDMGQPVTTDHERLVALLQQAVTPCPENLKPDVWCTVHRHGPEDD
jgi:hypothetical protein